MVQCFWLLCQSVDLREREKRGCHQTMAVRNVLGGVAA